MLVGSLVGSSSWIIVSAFLSRPIKHDIRLLRILLLFTFENFVSNVLFLLIVLFEIFQNVIIKCTILMGLQNFLNPKMVTHNNRQVHCTLYFS